jgi:menaquinone-dependent protoporphyrinogen IX oxidase
MKTIVVYKSKTGYTKRYAEWIAEELSADIFEISKVTLNVLKNYDAIIFGGGLYAVGINGIKGFKQNLNDLKGKKIVVFATGVSPWREEAINKVKDQNLSSEEQERIRFFYMRGGFEYSRLNPVDKVLMMLLKWKIKGKSELLKKKLTLDEKGMLSAYEKPVDFTKRKHIEEIIRYVLNT